MAEHVKVFEEKKTLPIWAWLLPLLLLLALLAWYFMHKRAEPVDTTSAQTSAAPTQSVPNLGEVKFATDSATLTPEDQTILTNAATFMKQNPNAHLRVEGYTDSTGTDSHNMNLSQQRAYAVAQFLQGQGIAGARLTGDGFGPAKPADTNSTEAGKADNRRVELFQQ